MTFRIRGLDPARFRPHYGLSDKELAARHVRRVRADTSPGFPDRIELRDARPGESLLLLNHEHQPHPTPYRASHAIVVLEGATEPADLLGEVPKVMQVRPISLRAFGAAHDMVDADLTNGADMPALIEHFFTRPDVAYLHAHYAKPGCFAAQIDRA